MRVLVIFLVLIISLPSQSQIWIEDFDGSNTTNPPTIDLACGPFGFDYFGIACCGSGCGAIEVNSTLCNFYQGESGNFLGAYNTDSGAGCDANQDDESATWTGINISSCSAPDKLYLCFEVANLHSTVGSSSNGWDDPSKVTFLATIDGGTPIELTAIEDQGSNSTPAFDSDCDGAGDGTELNQIMTEFCVQIPGTGGSLLDLQIQIDGLNEPLEEIIIDNIAIHCESDDSSLSGNYLGCGNPCADITPTFDAIPSQCSSGSNPLPLTSLEGYSGTWSPAFDPNNTTTYTFTPASGFCLSPSMLIVTIDIPSATTFDPITSQCAGLTNPLPATSLQGFTGTWSPAFDPNNTTTYTFTPDAGLCATNGMVSVTIDNPTATTFDPIPSQCAGLTNPLPATSLEGIAGSWSPVFDPNSTTTYTFTPDAGLCAANGMVTVTIDNPTATTFDPIPSQCAGLTNPLPATSLEGIAGSWSPVFDPNSTTTYTFTPDAGLCAANGMVTVTIDNPTAATFDPIPSQCAGLTDPLPATSLEGIAGSWSPAFDPNNTTTYTFTPDAGLCATNGMVSVTIDNPTATTFDPIPSQCAGLTNPLPATSLEGIAGSWSPVFDPNSTTTYIFTSDAGLCAANGMVTVTIDNPTATTFDPIPSQCAGLTNPLPATSLEGIAGSWSPVFDPNSTTTYTFTPDAGLCAANGMATVTIDNPTAATFDPIPSQCAGLTNPLPATSLEGLAGTWSPAFDPNNTTIYTFTPNAGLCATNGMATVTVEPQIIPTFTAIPSQCIGESNPLVNTSLQGIVGSWSPTFDPNNTTTYTFTPNLGNCAITTTITVNIDQLTTPSFTAIPNQCAGMTNPLNSISLESITGTWSPVFDPNNTTTYTFTPDPGQCADETMISVNIDQPATPDFTSPAPYCELDDLIYSLSLTSGNGISGSWSPAASYIPSALPIGTSIYTFDPDPSECALPITINIEVIPSVLPTFTALGPYCVGDVPDILPSISTNGINGSWNGPISTSTPGTITYTFMPDAGQCAQATTMDIVVQDCSCMNPAIVSIDPINPICENENISLVATLSGSASSLTWSSSGDGSFNSTSSLSPIYSPGTSDISSGTVTLSVTTNDPDGNGPCFAVSDQVILIINLFATPVFTQLGSYCQNEVADILPTTSLNGINGTWDGPISTNNPGSFDYTFTPTATECAISTNMTINIDVPNIATFDPISAQCAGGLNPLPIVSLEGFTGAWMPIFDPDNTTTYTFVVDAGQCAANNTLSVSITPLTSPLFTQLGPYCVDEAADALPTTSTNGITGTWDGVIATSSSGSVTYNFTPDANQCADNTSMTVVVNDCGCTDPAMVSIDPISDICQNENLSLTAALSGSATSVTWSTAGDGVFDDANSTTPTYTPGTVDIANGSVNLTATTDDPDGNGPCTAAIANILLTINSLSAPLFTQLGPYCVDETADALSTTSTNGITGTWDGVIATSSSGSVTYNFTPDANQCADNASMTIVVNDCGCTDPAMISIDPISDICQNENLSLTAALSGSATSVTWSTAGDGVFDDANSTTPTYTPGTVDIANGSVNLTATTDDPDGNGPCTAATANVLLTINSLSSPLFTQLGPYCVDEAADALPTTSTNGISGTWDGAIATSSSGSVTYNFTPDANQCTDDASMTIVVNDCGDCTSENTISVDCDDNDDCTINDQQIILESNGMICIPCNGEPVNCSTGESMVIPCDDGNPCTLNDVEEILECTGEVCIPCTGTKLNQSDIFHPNIFSPNSDGNNDFFTLYNNIGSEISIASLDVFDRYGNRVFSKSNFASNDPELGWNGMINNTKANQGVYLFIAIIDYEDCTSIRITGDITLVR